MSGHEGPRRLPLQMELSAYLREAVQAPVKVKAKRTRRAWEVTEGAELSCLKILHEGQPSAPEEPQKL